MSTVMKLSPHDRKELDKFTLFLACKSVQVIVQSRFGVKQKTKSKPHASLSDWQFNLDIPDLPEIQTRVNEAMAGQIPEPGGPSLCTQISLQTVDGDTLVLEVWHLSVSNVCDSSVRAIYTVYNRMSLLLKSLITITRVTPAYRLSHNQSRDSYIICFNVYMGEPQLDMLGEDYKRVQVGQVGTPTGTLTLGVVYRTKMTISPQQAVNQTHPAMMLKSDYFKPDLSPRGMRMRPRRKDGGDSLGEMQQGAFAPPCPRDLKEIAAREDESPWPLPKPAFSSLLSMPAKSTTSNNSRSEEDNDSDVNEPFVEPREVLLPAEDFVLVELKPPFADGEEGGTDLGTFFQECQSAPMLSSFSCQPTLEQQVSEISAHLAALESSLPDLDQFVESVCQSDSLK
ncbi:autophagy-related protein 13 isoform X3 [Dermacentor andersoni]|uniref:autophagy-related protein 13 isoform X3 n=1 Tax=Dermacentor andersoni TaxID=34620 RepID=UPI002155F6BC|nr:autophagy-related protein 13-like isoform X3 [Dermacentor andersoni]